MDVVHIKVLAGRVRALRRDRQIRQQDLAKALHVAQATIAKIETQKIHSVGSDILIGLAKFFNVSIDYLVGLVDEKGGYYAN